MLRSRIASRVARPQWHLGTLEASLARVTARSSPNKITWTVETDVFDQTACVAKEVGDGAAFRPIRGNAPTSPATSNRTSILEQCSDLAARRPCRREVARRCG